MNPASAGLPRSRRCGRSRTADEELGTYDPNTFLLVLGERTPFVSQQPDSDLLQADIRWAGVFWHEYWHYLQNVTTIEGFRTLNHFEQLLFQFRETLGPDGRSTGGPVGALSDWLIEERNRIGDWEPNDLRLPIVDAVVQDVLPQSDWVRLHGVDVDVPRLMLVLEATYNDASKGREDMVFGSLAIRESVAYAVEVALCRADRRVRFERSPVVPYDLLDRVLRYYLGDGKAPWLGTTAILGTLALLTGAPADTAVHLAKDLRSALDAGRTEGQWLDTTLDSFHAVVERSVRVVLDNDLPSLVDMHEKRGLVDGSMKLLAATFGSALTRRLEDPIFDLRCVFPRVDGPAFQRLQTDFPSCSVYQQQHGGDDDVGRDLLGNLDASDPDEKGLRPNDYLRSKQAQQHYVMSHLDDHDQKFLASAAALETCPYYTMCDLPLRTTRPSVCKERPWEAAHTPNHGCWYSTAVKATLGTVDVRLPNQGGGNER